MHLSLHRQVVWIGIVSAILALPLGLSAGEPASSRERGRIPVPDAKITGFHLVETKSGAKLWEIWGDLAEVFE